MILISLCFLPQTKVTGRDAVQISLIKYSAPAPPKVKAFSVTGITRETVRGSHIGKS